MATGSTTDVGEIVPADATPSVGAIRWPVALVGGLVAGIIALLRWRYSAVIESDLDHLWHAARAVLNGRNPYEAVGPGKAFEWQWGVLYPLPAILLITPFTVLPVVAARCAFSVVAGMTLGFAIGPRWRVLWPVFLSQAFFLAVARNQWSAFILAAIWLPVLGFFIAAKPNIGLIALSAQRRETFPLVILLAGALTVLAFIIRPSWLIEWMALARAAPNKEIALLQPAGFLLLGAVLLWRTMEGRLLLAAAIVPQTPSAYDALLLFPICKTRTQCALLALLTHAAQLVVLQLGPYESYDAYYDAMAKIVVLLIMLPALAMALGNKAVFRQHAIGPEPSRGSLLTHSFELVLLFLLFLAFALQLWILFG